MIGVGLSATLSGGRKARVNLDPMPALDLNFAANRSLPADYGPTPSFSRASTGTFFNSSGVLTSAAVNVPRFDHILSGGSWVSRGLLVEEQRTNSLTYSEDLTNAAWTKYQLTISGNAATAPDGTTTADKLLETAVSDYHVLYQNVSISSPKSFSIFLKAAERSAATISFDASGSTTYLAITFNLSSGTVSQEINNSTATYFATIASVGNGWYRCAVNILTIGNLDGTRGGRLATNTTATPTIGGYGLETYLGDITKGILAWGFQYEAGAFTTSYIPTTSSSATRSADVCQITGTSFSSFYNQSEGAFVLEYDRLGAITSSFSGGYPRYFTVDDGSLNNRMGLLGYTGSPSNEAFYAVTGGSSQGDTLIGASSAGGVLSKIGFAYKSNDAAASLNGASVVADTTFSVPTVTQLQIGYYDKSTSSPINGHISRLCYYPTRLTNAQLQSLST